MIYFDPLDNRLSYEPTFLLKLAGMKTFTELFKTILTADKDTSRKAAREVRKLLYSYSAGNKYKSIALIIDKAPLEYEKIKESWRQENFVMSISVIYFLHNKKSQPDFLFPWLFKLLHYENGYIRYASVRMIENELGPLTYHIRFPNRKSSILNLSPKRADFILFELYTHLNNLMANFWKPEYKRYKYISSLPAGVYKSIQLILSRLEECCGKEYIDCMAGQTYLTGRQTPFRA